MAFAIVVDSTCDMSLAELEELGVTMVALNVQVDGESYADQTEISSEEFYDRMEASEGLPKTSQPAPFEFVEAYRSALDGGADGVLSLCIAAPLSGTVESARMAAGQVDGDVRVVDTCTASAAMALLVRRAVELRDAAMSLERAVEELESVKESARFFIACETLDNLLKGGRLKQEEAQAACALNIKPIFAIDSDGKLVAHGKARGTKGVVRSYRDEAACLARMGRVAIRFCNVRNPEAVDAVKRALDEAGVDYVDAGTGLCGAIVATHVGLGAFGLGVMPVDEG